MQSMIRSWKLQGDERLFPRKFLLNFQATLNTRFLDMQHIKDINIFVILDLRIITLLVYLWIVQLGWQ